jgi:hypothetical protein
MSLHLDLNLRPDISFATTTGHFTCLPQLEKDYIDLIAAIIYPLAGFWAVREQASLFGAAPSIVPKACVRG